MHSHIEATPGKGELMIPRELKASEVEFAFTAEEEHIHPSDSFTEESDIVFALGGGAHWFCAKMTATWNGYEGVTYLGGCSYNSFKEFLELEGDNLRSEALDALNAEIKDACKKVSALL